jgi:hypothetical protein
MKTHLPRTENEVLQRGQAAERLLDEPVLRDAFEAVEESTLAELLACRGAEPEDDRKRRALVERINVLHELRADLALAMSQGKTPKNRQKNWV